MGRTGPLALALALALVLGACREEAPPPEGGSPTGTTPAATETGTEPAEAETEEPEPSPEPEPTAGPATAKCVNGWITPQPGTKPRTYPLDIIRFQMGVEGLFVVEDIRYFTGPDVPWIIEPHYEVVRRWYVKAHLQDDPSFRGRWLIERRSKTVVGIAAVAPYDTTGYRSPDWRGFIGEGTPQKYEGLPGKWVGINYDFVTGEGDGGMPGLPDEVVGCTRGA